MSKSQIEKLTQELAYQEAATKDNDRPNPARGQHAKAKTLIKLGQFTNDKSYYQQAIECLAQAIKLDPQNAPYLVSRSKVYTTIQEWGLAAKDIAEAQKYEGTSGSQIKDMYNAKAVRDILKLVNVQAKVKEMIDKKELPLEIEKVFSEIIYVVNGINLKVSVHEERLDTHDVRLAENERELLQVKVQLNKYGAEFPVLTQTVKLMIKDIEELQTKLAERNLKLEDHETRLKQSEEYTANILSELAKLGLGKEQLEKMSEDIKTQSISNEKIDAAVKELTQIITLSNKAKEVSNVCASFTSLSIEEKNHVSSQFTESEKMKNAAIGSLTTRFAGYEEQAAQYKKLVDTLRGKVLELQRKHQDIADNVGELKNVLGENLGGEENVYFVSEIIYDLPLLNYPTLIAEVQKHFKLKTLDEVLKVAEQSIGISPELMSAAAFDNDFELFLAGLISINNNVEIKDV